MGLTKRGKIDLNKTYDKMPAKKPMSPIILAVEKSLSKS